MPLARRHWVEAEYYPVFTMLGQSLGSLVLGAEALTAFVPTIFMDTMGYSFTMPLFKVSRSSFGQRRPSSTWGGAGWAATSTTRPSPPTCWPGASPSPALARVGGRQAMYNNRRTSPLAAWAKLRYYRCLLPTWPSLLYQTYLATSPDPQAVRLAVRYGGQGGGHRDGQLLLDRGARQAALGRRGDT